MDLSKISWGKITGVAVGAALAGSVGALAGAYAGTLLEHLLPRSAELAAALSTFVAKTVEQSSDEAAKQLSAGEKRQINHDLQTAFRDALLTALQETGGPACFPDARLGLPSGIGSPLPIAALASRRPELAEQLCALLRQLVADVRSERLLPLEPPAGQPLAAVDSYLTAETPGEMSVAFVASVIEPHLAQGPARQLLPELAAAGLDLISALRRHLLDRTLAHFGELLKERTPAWRAFNRLMLNQLHSEVRALAAAPAAQSPTLPPAALAELETALAELRGQAQQSGALADGLADLLAAVARSDKRSDERFDQLLTEGAARHSEAMARLTLLVTVTGRIEGKVDRVLRLLEDGGYEIVGSPAAALDEPPAPGEPPFLGLHSFTERDAGLFFGRGALVARLAAALHERRFLAVVGASGSGKSSLVSAGLLPALRRGEPLAGGVLPPDGSARWLIRLLRPTAKPLESLAAALTADSPTAGETAALPAELQSRPAGLPMHLRRLLSRTNGAAPHALLVVDQFEELFTLCHDEQERAAFVEALMAAAGEGSPAGVVIVLRADFYAHCAHYAALRAALATSQEFIGPMSPDELRQAIEEPARRGGWQFERGLVEIILRDVGEEPGALPLLSHALLETWKRRRGRTMMLESYAESGMVRGAIAQTAGAVFRQRLAPDEQAAARAIFLRLIVPGEGVQDTRRRAPLSEIADGGAASGSAALAGVGRVLHILAQARLITVDEQTVELAHEALIREWPVLRDWIDQSREALRVHRRLTEAAHEWQGLGGDPEALYRGARLAQAREWAAQHGGEMNELERRFFEASLQKRAAEEAERTAGQRRELERAQEMAATQAAAARQLRRGALLLAALLLAAAVLAGVAALQSRAATRSAAAAVAQQATAESERVRADAESRAARAAEASLGVALEESEAARLEAETLRGQEAAARRQAESAAAQALARGLAAAALNNRTDADLALLLGVQASRGFSPASRSQTPAGYEPLDAALLSALSANPYLTRLLHDPDTGRSGAGGSGGAGEPVYAAEISPDGRSAAAGGVDGIVRIWDTGSGRLLAELPGKQGVWITSLAYSPDGATLAAGSRELRLWDAATYRPVGEPLSLPAEGGPREVWGLAFSHAGDLLAAAGPGNALYLFDVADRSRPALLGPPLAGHTDWVRSLAFSSDDRTLASGSWDRTVRLWDVANPARPAPLGELAGHTDWVRDVAFHPSRPLLASAGGDKTVVLWDVATGREVDRLENGHSEQIYSVSFSPDGALLASAGGDKTIRLWEVASGALAGAPLTGHAGEIQHVSFAPLPAALAGGGADSAAADSNATDSSSADSSSTDSSSADSGATGAGLRLVSAGGDGAVGLWNLRTPHPLCRPLHTHAALPNSVAFSGDGAWLASADSGGTVAVWEMKAEPALAYELENGSGVNALAFRPGGAALVTGDDAGRLLLLDAATGRTLRTWEGAHSGAVDAVAFSPDGARLASGGIDGAVKVWDVESGALVLGPLRGHAGAVYDVAFHPHKPLLASAGDDNTIVLWDAESGERLRVLNKHTWMVYDIEFSPEGAALASGGRDAMLFEWDVDAGEPLMQQSYHTNTVSGVAYAAGGRFLASASADRSVILWDREERQQFGGPLVGHTDFLSAIAGHPTRPLLATAAYDRTLCLWDLAPAAWEEAACRIANRSINREEWARYVGDGPDAPEYQPVCRGAGS